MKHNGPVTRREFALEPGATLVSATDLDSRITYANPAFVAASGFTREQLIGQPHHVIRHPDMPAEAFRDLWATLRSGRPWSGLVKNRRQDGDHYWVRANVTPVLEHGRVAGYMSVRTCPARAEVQAAEALYATLRVDGLHHASREIRGGNGDLAGRTESQASSLEQTAAALEQITATIRANAEAAQGAFATASEAAAVAERGGAAAAEAARCMQEIAAASARIGDIIGTVDAIAFQTRMLSLNAAVEAARAGEAGRGFAVVAAEVRALAQRTSEAAREVRGLIGAASARIAAGSALVQATGETAQGTVAAVQRVNALVDGIRRASAEQAAGVSEVNGAVAGLDAITQQNAALVQQLAASAGTLEGRAAEVAQAVRIFRTEAARA